MSEVSNISSNLKRCRLYGFSICNISVLVNAKKILNSIDDFINGGLRWRLLGVYFGINFRYSKMYFNIFVLKVRGKIIVNHIFTLNIIFMLNFKTLKIRPKLLIFILFSVWLLNLHQLLNHFLCMFCRRAFRLSVSLKFYICFLVSLIKVFILKFLGSIGKSSLFVRNGPRRILFRLFVSTFILIFIYSRKLLRSWFSGFMILF